MSNIGMLDLYRYICGQIKNIILQRYDIHDVFTSWSNNFDTESFYQFVKAGETPLMRYVEVTFQSEVVSSIGSKISDADTYVGMHTINSIK